MSQPAGSSQAPIAEVDMQTCSNQILAGTMQPCTVHNMHYVRVPTRFQQALCNRAPCTVHNMHYADVYQVGTRLHSLVGTPYICFVLSDWYYQSDNTKQMYGVPTRLKQTNMKQTPPICSRLRRYMLHAENKPDIYLCFSFKQNIHTISIKFYLHGI